MLLVPSIFRVVPRSSRVDAVIPADRVVRTLDPSRPLHQLVGLAFGPKPDFPAPMLGFGVLGLPRLQFEGQRLVADLSRIIDLLHGGGDRNDGKRIRDLLSFVKHDICCSRNTCPTFGLSIQLARMK
jgi:hypothetical protein